MKTLAPAVFGVFMLWGGCEALAMGFGEHVVYFLVSCVIVGACLMEAGKFDDLPEG